MKSISLISWNVNGVRAATRKGFLEWLVPHQFDVGTVPSSRKAKTKIGAARDQGPADIVAIQETKAKPNQLGENILSPDGYQSFWSSAIRPGYSGTATYSQIQPLKTETEFPAAILNGEGRILHTEFEHFHFLNVYFPNGKASEERLQYKLDFYKAFLKLIEKLRKEKPIVFCGDVNTAHTAIDLARPKENEQISGFLEIERKWIDQVIAKGYLDTFRITHAEEKDRYSWWSMRSGARERNVGWRIDYFFVSSELEKNVITADIHPDIMGSDHCPVSLKLKI